MAQRTCWSVLAAAAEVQARSQRASILPLDIRVAVATVTAMLPGHQQMLGLPEEDMELQVLEAQQAIRLCSRAVFSQEVQAVRVRTVAEGAVVGTMVVVVAVRIFWLDIRLARAVEEVAHTAHLQ